MVSAIAFPTVLTFRKRHFHFSVDTWHVCFTVPVWHLFAGQIVSFCLLSWHWSTHDFQKVLHAMTVGKALTRSVLPTYFSLAALGFLDWKLLLSKPPLVAFKSYRERSSWWSSAQVKFFVIWIIAFLDLVLAPSWRSGTDNFLSPLSCPDAKILCWAFIELLDSWFSHSLDTVVDHGSTIPLQHQCFAKQPHCFCGGVRLQSWHVKCILTCTLSPWSWLDIQKSRYTCFKRKLVETHYIIYIYTHPYRLINWDSSSFRRKHGESWWLSFLRIDRGLSGNLPTGLGAWPWWSTHDLTWFICFILYILARWLLKVAPEITYQIIQDLRKVLESVKFQVAPNVLKCVVVNFICLLKRLRPRPCGQVWSELQGGRINVVIFAGCLTGVHYESAWPSIQITSKVHSMFQEVLTRKNESSQIWPVHFAKSGQLASACPAIYPWSAEFTMNDNDSFVSSLGACHSAVGTSQMSGFFSRWKFRFPEDVLCLFFFRKRGPSHIDGTFWHVHRWAVTTRVSPWTPRNWRIWTIWMNPDWFGTYPHVDPNHSSKNIHFDTLGSKPSNPVLRRLPVVSDMGWGPIGLQTCGGHRVAG